MFTVFKREQTKMGANLVRRLNEGHQSPYTAVLTQLLRIPTADEPKAALTSQKSTAVLCVRAKVVKQELLLKINNEIFQTTVAHSFLLNQSLLYRRSQGA